jgi:hypothetical protein
VIGILRPHAWDLPLFLHVFGAMVLFGAMLATATLSLTGWRLPGVAALSRSTFWALLGAALPAWIVMRVGAQWTYSKEHHHLFEKDPTWIGIGFGVADAGLLILLITTALAFWWQRSHKPVAGRLVSGFALLYAILLTIAWLAMSGKWGS